MSRLLSAFFAVVLFSPSALSFAGDCNKTVMGGGCTAEPSAGVAAHMRSQPVVKPLAVKAVAKETATPKTMTLSTVANNKPQMHKPQI